MSETVEVLVGKLEGAALDWAVASVTDAHDDDDHALMEIGLGRYSPSTDWSQGGPLIGERVVLVEKWEGHREPWVAWVASNMPGECGSTLLIAAMRAIVAADSQDAVNVPRELMQC